MKTSPASTLRTKRAGARAAPIIIGPLIAFAIAAATSSIRDQVGASNVGIALAIVVALAALVSRGAALSTAVTAALAFNFFHTKPYHSLRVHEPHDVAIVALLAVLGLVISDITAWRRRREAIAHRHDRATAAPSTIGALVADVHPVAVVWPAVVNAILDQLSLAECYFVEHQPTDLPVIARATSRYASGIDGEDSFILPAKGAAIAVQSANEVVGYLVIAPEAGSTSLSVERRTVVALADHLAIALSYGGPRADPTVVSSAPG